MSEVVDKAKLIIARRFSEKLLLDELSKEIGMSKFHFHRMFKKESGVTLNEYINTIRLEHTVHMIKMYPHHSITDIAFEVGYSSPAVFSRAFKQKYHTSPSDFKKNITSKQNQSVNETPNKIPICYLEKKTICVQPCNLLTKNIEKALKKVDLSPESTGKIYGIYLDAPMHKEPEQSRFYIGSECSRSATLTYELDSGYYTYLDVKGKIEEVTQQIVDFKEQSIDRSGYEIDSLVGFEVFDFNGNNDEFDYTQANRRLFIKIKKK